MRIAAGISDQCEIDAIRRACREIGLDAKADGIVIPLDVKNIRPDLKHLFDGANRRMLDVRQADTRKDAIYIGIETGVVFFGLDTERNLYISAIEVRLGNQSFYTSSASIGLAQQCVMDAMLAEREVNALKVAKIVTKEDNGDVYAALTGERMQRVDTLVQALKIVLSQLLQRGVDNHD